MSDIIVWYFWMQVFALVGWVVSSNWLGRLPDRGYAISKPIGMLLVGFVYWLLVVLGLSPNGPGAILMALLAVALVGIGLHAFNAHHHQEQKYLHLPGASTIIATELVFALAFLVCTIYRSYTPDIQEAGGEKFMESMFLNAILHSPNFPPNDAWLSGFSISYYYFGYIILAMVTRMTGIASAVAFNLGGAMIFALTLVSAYGVGYNLWGTYIGSPVLQGPLAASSPQKLGRIPSTSAVLAGVLAALMLGVMGNMGGFMESVRCSHVLPASFWAWLDVRQIDKQPIECKGLIPTRFYWWWDWSRVVHDYTPTGADQEVITETPAFSFILGDNHPHVMSLPFVLVGITLALYYLTAKRDIAEPTPASESGLSKSSALTLDGLNLTSWFIRESPHILLSATVIGGLSFMNTWDFPVYGALLAGAVLLGRWYRREAIVPGVVFSVLVFVLGYLLYIPFYSTFASQARGIGVNLFNGTRFIQFALMFAPFIVAAPLFLLQTAKGLGLSARPIAWRVLLYTAAALILALIAMVILGAFSTQGRVYMAELAQNGSVSGVTREVIIQRLTQRLTDPWTPVFLLLLASGCGVMILSGSRCCKSMDQPSVTVADAQTTQSQLISRFVLLLFLGGALLTVAVEFIFLQDLFGTRMNTVFKFYYQAWTVWAIAGSFALMTFLANRGVIAGIGTVAVGLLLLAGLLFPIYAAASKTDNFTNKPTLDGSAYLQRSRPDDANMISWLNTHVRGAPTIVEAPADHYGAYQYNGRISAFTGLPTLLGWGGHEHQWRGNYDEPARREPLIESLYNTTDLQKAQDILREFSVRYVIVGQTERAKYAPEGLAKFGQLCNTVYESGQSMVYECNP